MSYRSNLSLDSVTDAIAAGAFKISRLDEFIGCPWIIVLLIESRFHAILVGSAAGSKRDHGDGALDTVLLHDAELLARYCSARINPVNR